MMNDWFKRVGSSVPRGFSRYFILELLKDGPHTGKEIIDHATKESNGIWKPSPGLIYPLLGRLFDEGLIDETAEGRYQLTKKGRSTAEDIGRIGDIVRKQLDVMLRIGNVGRFAAMDLLEKMATMGSALSSNIANMTEAEVARYRRFLQAELKKLEERAAKEKGSTIKIE